MTVIRWLPYIIVSCVWAGMTVQAFRHQRYRRLFWWLGCWALATLTWTPIAFSFGSSSVGQVMTHWIAGGIWVLRPFERASMDTSFWLNIVMTVPQRILLKMNWPRLRWPQWLLAGVATGLTLEAGQALGNWLVSLGRWVDINDVITNGLGVFIGAFLMSWIQRRDQAKI